MWKKTNHKYVIFDPHFYPTITSYSATCLFDSTYEFLSQMIICSKILSWLMNILLILVLYWYNHWVIYKQLSHLSMTNKFRHQSCTWTDLSTESFPPRWLPTWALCTLVCKWSCFWMNKMRDRRLRCWIGGRSDRSGSGSGWKSENKYEK